MRTLDPLGDRVCVQVIAAKERTDAGLLLAPQAVEAPQEAIITAVGPEVQGLFTGDRVIYPRFAGTELTIDGAAVLVLSSREVIGVLRDPSRVTINANGTAEIVEVLHA